MWWIKSDEKRNCCESFAKKRRSLKNAQELMCGMKLISNWFLIALRKEWFHSKCNLQKRRWWMCLQLSKFFQNTNDEVWRFKIRKCDSEWVAVRLIWFHEKHLLFYAMLGWIGENFSNMFGKFHHLLIIVSWKCLVQYVPMYQWNFKLVLLWLWTTEWEQCYNLNLKKVLTSSTAAPVI